MAYRSLPPNGHHYDKQCGCAYCTAYEIRLSACMAEEKRQEIVKSLKEKPPIQVSIYGTM